MERRTGFMIALLSAGLLGAASAFLSGRDQEAYFLEATTNSTTPNTNLLISEERRSSSFEKTRLEVLEDKVLEFTVLDSKGGLVGTELQIFDKHGNAISDLVLDLDQDDHYFDGFHRLGIDGKEDLVHLYLLSPNSHSGDKLVPSIALDQKVTQLGRIQLDYDADLKGKVTGNKPTHWRRLPDFKVSLFISSTENHPRLKIEKYKFFQRGSSTYDIPNFEPRRRYELTFSHPEYQPLTSSFVRGEGDHRLDAQLIVPMKEH